VSGYFCGCGCNGSGSLECGPLSVCEKIVGGNPVRIYILLLLAEQDAYAGRKIMMEKFISG